MPRHALESNVSRGCAHGNGQCKPRDNNCRSVWVRLKIWILTDYDKSSNDGRKYLNLKILEPEYLLQAFPFKPERIANTRN
jgi:hypothetical protein